MMGRYSCAGKEIQVQSANVARRLWHGGRCGFVALLLIMMTGSASVLAAGLPSPSATVRRSTFNAQRAFDVQRSADVQRSTISHLGLDGAVYQQADLGDPSYLPEVWAGLAGLSKPGRWLTVRAIVANEGPPLDGELRIGSRPGLDALYTQRVQLATHARKLLTFQIPGPTSSAELRLTLRVGEIDVSVRDVPVRMLSPNDFMVGVMTDDGVVPSGLGAVRRGGNPVAVAQLTPTELPAEPLGFQALDALVIRQASTDRLTPEQRAALRSWIEQGGQLIVTGGPGWRRSMDGLDELLPVQGLWTRQVKHLRALGYYAGVTPPEEDVLVTLGSPVEGARVLLIQEGVPLIAERWIGLGRVTYLGPDPGLEPFRSWPAADSLWQRILVGGRPGLPTLDLTSSGWMPMRSALNEMLDLGLPAAAWIIGFLVVYVSVVGPGQYFLLRRFDRREWAWISFPLLALGSAGLLLGCAAWLRGPDVRLAAVSIVRVSEDARMAPVDTYLGLVAPTRGSYNLTMTDGLVPRPVSEGGGSAPAMTIVPGVGGDPTTLPDLRLEGRVPRALQIRSLVSAPAPIVADLKTTNGRLEGTVRNTGPDRLEDAIVVAAGEANGLGDLGPGESRPVSISLPTNRAAGAWQNGPPPWAVPGARTGPGGDRRRALIAQLVQPNRGSDGETNGGVMLLAWGPATVPRISVGAGAVPGSARRLIEQALPVEYGEEQVTIPPGLIGRTIVDGAVLGRGNVSSFVARGPIVFQFDLPPGVELTRIDRLSVHLATPGRPAGAPATLPVMTSPSASGAASPAPRLSLYRWADRTWVDVPLSGTGVSNMSFGAAFVDGGSIRARIEPQGNEIQVDQLDLSLDGVRE
jgi:hypothetical protein